MSTEHADDVTRRAVLTQATLVAAVPLVAAGMAATPYTAQPVAWERFLAGATAYRRYTPEANAQARALFTEALDLNPRFARAYASLAAAHRQDWTLRWTPHPADSLALAFTMAETAVACARREPPPQPSLPYALEQWAYVLSYSKDQAAAMAAAQEAVTVKPDYADGWTVWAHALTFAGAWADALTKTRHAMSLVPPPHPFFYDYHLGHALYVQGAVTGAAAAYAEAETCLGTSLRKNPQFRPPRTYRVAALWELGRQAEAGAEMATLRAMGRPLASADPAAFRAYVTQQHPYTQAAILERLIVIWTEAEGWMAGEATV